MSALRSSAANSRPRRPARGRALLPALVLLFAGGAAWWYFAPNTLPTFVKAQLPAPPKSDAVLYKWRDAKGGLHVTDTPPPDRPYETVRYDPNANVLPKGVAPSK
jgi:hypothetical protein